MSALAEKIKSFLSVSSGYGYGYGDGSGDGDGDGYGYGYGDGSGSGDGYGDGDACAPLLRADDAASGGCAGVLSAVRGWRTLRQGL